MAKSRCAREWGGWGRLILLCYKIGSPPGETSTSLSSLMLICGHERQLCRARRPTKPLRGLFGPPAKSRGAPGSCSSSEVLLHGLTIPRGAQECGADGGAPLSRERAPNPSVFAPCGGARSLEGRRHSGSGASLRAANDAE